MGDPGLTLDGEDEAFEWEFRVRVGAGLAGDGDEALLNEAGADATGAKAFEEEDVGEAAWRNCHNGEVPKSDRHEEKCEQVPTDRPPKPSTG